MHSVAVIAFPGVVPFDLSTPCEVFGRASLADGRPAYEVGVCGPSRAVNAGAFELKARWPLSLAERAQTVIVPGVADLDAPSSRDVLDIIRSAHARGARVASICTGAFVLAETGLLDGLRATTHWAAAAELARRHPRITVDPDVLFVDEGQLLTSAGAAAGLDLCLHLVRRDCGATVAANTARLSVMPLQREGGQAQFIVPDPIESEATSLQPLLRWVERNLQDDLALARLAERAGLSQRSLSRKFRDQLGQTPAQWVLAARVRRAQQLLEGTAQPVERVGEQAGFGSAATFRERFHRLVGTSPQAYRRAFRATARRG